MDFHWYFIQILTEFSTDFHGYFIEISTVFSTKKSIVFIEISIEFFYGFPMDIHYYFQLDFQSIRCFIEISIGNFKWIFNGLHKYFIGISIQNSLKFQHYFNWIFIVITLKFLLNFYWIFTGFPLEFH